MIAKDDAWLTEQFRSAASQVQQGRDAAAAASLQLILERHTAHAPSLQLLGIVRARQGMFVEAISCLQTASTLAPQSAEVHNNLGMALHAAGRFEEASFHFENAVRLKPSQAHHFNNLGMALAALNKNEKAVTQYRHALALQPRYPEAHNNLANVLSNLGKDDEAIGHFKNALAARPQFAEARANLGRLLSKLERHDEALAEYRQALALEPKSAVLRYNLGTALHALSRHSEAIEQYNAALALDPSIAIAANNLGLALKELGRLDEARKAYEIALALEPRQPGHYAGLIGTKKFALDDPQLAEMLDLASQMPTFPPEDQVNLHFALGAALSEAGENDRSFRHIREGNALRRKLLNYQEAVVLGRLERTRNTFGAELMRSKEGLGNPSRLPIFIVGMPRSGSTLVEQILASHPAVHAAGEINAFREAVRNVSRHTASIAFPENVPAMSREQLQSLASDYLEGLNKIAGRSAVGKARITDKLPANYRYAGLIHLALPHATIIHTRRDAVDTCLSCFSTNFVSQPFSFELGELGRYYRAYERIMSHWRDTLPSGVILDVGYEDLIQDFESQARRIIAHCGLDWNDACLAFNEARRPVRTASLTQVRQPLYRSSIGRWRPNDDLLRPLLQELRPAPSSTRSSG